MGPTPRFAARVISRTLRERKAPHVQQDPPRADEGNVRRQEPSSSKPSRSSAARSSGSRATSASKGLAHVSNAKLLRLHATFSEVKDQVRHTREAHRRDPRAGEAHARTRATASVSWPGRFRASTTSTSRRPSASRQARPRPRPPSPRPPHRRSLPRKPRSRRPVPRPPPRRVARRRDERVTTHGFQREAGGHFSLNGTERSG